MCRLYSLEVCRGLKADFNTRDSRVMFVTTSRSIDERICGMQLQADDPRVLAAVKAGKVMEVSTGLFIENEPSSGTMNGQAYTAIARDHRPDHLAILPDQVGACSVAMGAGLCRNHVFAVQRQVERPLICPSLVFA